MTASQSLAYRYDALGRRIEEDFDGSSSLNENYRRLHDANGNTLAEWNAGLNRTEY